MVGDKSTREGVQALLSEIMGSKLHQRSNTRYATATLLCACKHGKYVIECNLFNVSTELYTGSN